MISAKHARELHEKEVGFTGEIKQYYLYQIENKIKGAIDGGKYYLTIDSVIGKISGEKISITSMLGRAIQKWLEAEGYTVEYCGHSFLRISW
jgi:TRAP-type C4-dicarboxylate transport system permease large subunit